MSLSDNKTSYITIGQLQISAELAQFVATEVAPETGITAEHFWLGLASIIEDLAPKNKQLIDKREVLQQQINQWHINNAFELSSYKQFLNDIGYLLPEGDDFTINTKNVDDEIAHIAGPQLVVPVNNARFALNAANARWGSLYDALYGTDVISEEDGSEKGNTFNPTRGKEVIKWTALFLDQAVPLISTSHKQVKQYRLVDTTPKNNDPKSNNPQNQTLIAELIDGTNTSLQQPEKFIGFNQVAISKEEASKEEQSTGSDSNNKLTSILLKNNNLHIEIQIDKNDKVGALSASGTKDVILESALSTILDCEDSVSAVDATDKLLVYKNWLGIMKGTLQELFNKSGTLITRKLNADRHYLSPSKQTLTLHGRSLLFVRNVGHLMTTDAVLDKKGNEIPEGILDAMITSFCALHDLNKKGQLSNSRTGSIYIVKPKMHGPEEVAFTNELFTRVEQVLALPVNTLKVGIMDEERRTSVNLKQCVEAVKNRLVFINTGFLDRTGDEIHTSMMAGAFMSKSAMKEQPWINAYEDRNVDIGLLCGLPGKAQIGKGMWAMPDAMADMMASKQKQPEAGANCAWVPSPTAATLHVTHYHKVNVKQKQQQLKTRPMADVDRILTPPLLLNKTLTPKQIQTDLNNNIQAILGYVVRWVELGVGCSKVPNIDNVGLMEDRATLRLASQHTANWLQHNICSKDEVMSTLKSMAVIVDEQNKHDVAYIKMAPNFNTSIAFKAACDLIFNGCSQPSGYTEPLLHAYRKEAKTAQGI